MKRPETEALPTQPRGIAGATPLEQASALAAAAQQLKDTLSRQATRLRSVLEIGAQISAVRDVDALLRIVMDRVTQVVGAEASALFMLDEEKGELWSRVLKGSQLKEIRVARDAGIVGHVVQSGKTLLLADAYADVRFNPDIDRKSGFRTRSVVAAPLRHVSGRVLGVVEVLDRRIAAFNDEDAAVVEAIASQIAAVLDNVLLLEALRVQNAALKEAQGELASAVRDLDLLFEIEKELSAGIALQPLLDTVLTRIIAAVGARSGSILLLEADRNALYFRSAQGARAEALKSVALKPGQGIAGHVAAVGRKLRLLRADESPHHDKALARKLGVPIEAVVCVPIRSGDQLWGAIELFNKSGGFGELDERLLELVASQVARALSVRATRDAEQRETRLASIGQMLSGVLHDIRAPMGIISGYAQMMVDEASEAERKGCAGVIEGQLRHLDAMTRETLAFARGERQILVRKVYLQQFTQELRALLEQEFQGTGVELRFQINYLGPARFDESKLKRVIHNLARNAIEAMPEGGRFTVSLDQDDKTLLWRFADTGPGIPEEIQDRVFESFVTAGKKNGTGLGLAIVAQIVAEHGGSISVKSKPGRGAVFELRLPLQA